MPFCPGLLDCPVVGRLICLGGLLVLASCAQTSPAFHQARGEKVTTVYVVHHGALHTGLTIRRTDIPKGYRLASRDFASSKYIEVGWGDDDGYRKPLTSGIALNALLGDRKTVVLADGFSQPPARKYSDAKFTVLAVDLPASGFRRLCEHIGRTYALDQRGHPVSLGGGWYRARGTYSAFNTCNTWIAAGLSKAGCPISAFLCVTPGQLLGRVRPFARVISEPATSLRYE